MTKRQVLAAGVFLALLLAAASTAWWATRGSGAGTAGPATKYHCPMHPTMVFDRPGDCPICGMRLVPIDQELTDAAAPEHTVPPPSGRSAGKKVVYRSTMNPNEVSDTPGRDSMGMDMVPVEVEEQNPEAAAAVSGLSTVRVSSQKQQLIGVRTSVVTRAPFRRTIRAVGRVTYDEKRLKHVHTKISGYIETLHANATGELVRQGQPLLEIYSPELLASQQEYLVALRARSRTAGSSLPFVAASGDELVVSARRRLELFDLSDEQIRALETTGQAQRTVSLYAPISGYIVERNVTQGEKIEPETRLLTLADLSRVWVVAAVYEYELPFVREGQKAVVALSYAPETTVEGRVSLVYPVLDASTRTVQVRLELANPGLLLKPEMYAEVRLEADLGERLAVPDTAVIESGQRSIAFVDRGAGVFEPRELVIGLRLPDLYEVVSGVAEGESVLTSGNFFVDSESRLKAALDAMAGEPAAPAHQH